MPFGMRPSSLEERKRFYESFDLKRSRNWVGRKLVYAAIIGRHSGVYPPEYKEDKNVPLVIDNYTSLKEVMRYILHFLPEGVYYDRNYYHNFSLCHSHDLRDCWNWGNFAGQQLAFDLDPENVDCPIHGPLSRRLHKQGLSFCKTAFEIARQNTVSLFDELSSQYSDVRAVFSGRGFHIHVFDSDAISLTRRERAKIAEQYSHFGIDKWVTEGEMRLMRLPYTLNGISSRIVTPLKKSEIASFDPAIQALPPFL